MVQPFLLDINKTIQHRRRQRRSSNTISTHLVAFAAFCLLVFSTSNLYLSVTGRMARCTIDTNGVCVHHFTPVKID
jgi:hypothetical protein